MPKRNASNRIVPLTDGVIEAFLKLKEIQENDKNSNIKWGSENEFRKTYPDLVLTTKDGNYFLQTMSNKNAKGLLKKSTPKAKRSQKKKIERMNQSEFVHICFDIHSLQIVINRKLIRGF